MASITLAAACSGTADRSSSGDESDLTQTATIVFKADGTFTAPGHLVEGQKLAVEYPVAGRAVCPDGGEESLEGDYSIDGGHGTHLVLDGTTPDGKFMTGQLVVPHGQHLALWFSRHDIVGHTTCWDSNGGHNFVVPVSPNALPTISFEAHGVHQTGTLVAGAKAQIRYALDRKPCGVNGTLEGNVQAAGGPATKLPPADLNDAERVMSFTFTVPQAHQVSFWFEGTGMGTESMSGCVGWDSDGGRNFTFAVSAP